jgi:hypothetical protein
MTNLKRKHNTLTPNQKHRLAEWIKTQWEMIAKVRPTMDAVAAEAVKKLGFSITASNLRYAVSMAFDDGRTWPRSTGSSHSPRAMRIVIRELVTFIESAGSTPSQALKDLDLEYNPPSEVGG